jgi:hypothetical protein
MLETFWIFLTALSHGFTQAQRDALKSKLSNLFVVYTYESSCGRDFPEHAILGAFTDRMAAAIWLVNHLGDRITEEQHDDILDGTNELRPDPDESEIFMILPVARGIDPENT